MLCGRRDDLLEDIEVFPRQALDIAPSRRRQRGERTHCDRYQDSILVLKRRGESMGTLFATEP